MKKNFWISTVVFSILCCILSFPFFDVSVARASSLPQQEEGNLVSEPQVFHIVVNNAKFDGAVYSYDMNDYFSPGKNRLLTYEIVSDEAMDPQIAIDKESGILTITPIEAFEKTITILATETDDNFHTATFALKFINAPPHLSSFMLTLFLIALISLVLFVVCTIFLSPLSGKLYIAPIENGCPSDSKSIKLIHILGSAWTPRSCPLSGIFLGRRGKKIKFIPFGEVYVKDTDNFKKVASFAVPVSNKTAFYKDDGGLEGISVYFYKK